MSSITVHILAEGYSTQQGEGMQANCSCVLVKGNVNVIIDTMTAWDKDFLINALAKHNLSTDDIQFVIGTHGHSDHVGNLNLFTKATHIVGFNINKGQEYQYHPFVKGASYFIGAHIEVMPTPGHMHEHVSVLIRTAENTVAVAGDLFEHEDDIKNPALWIEAGSENAEQQRENRLKVALRADRIIPGHGPCFSITDEHRKMLQEQMESRVIKMNDNVTDCSK